MTTASLLPNGRQQFFDSNGNPLAGGTIAYYIPGTTTYKNTWQDAGQAALNTNPVLLDDLGSCQVYGSGQYRQVVRDSLGNLIWDALTNEYSIPTTSGGSSTTSIITETATLTTFRAITSSTVSTPLVYLDGYAFVNDGGQGFWKYDSSDVSSADNGTSTIVDSSGRRWKRSAFPAGASNSESILASAATCDLGSADTNMIAISGTTTIVSFGTGADATNPIYFVRFTGICTLTYNATSMILPNASDLTTGAGDFGIFQYIGGGNWRCLSYTTATGSVVTPPTASYVVGKYTRIRLTSPGGATTITGTLKAVTMEDSSLHALRASNVSLTINGGTAGANGIDTGSLVPNAWYYIYAISNSTTTAGLLSLSASAPTLPSGYTYSALIGVALTSSTGFFVAFSQLDDSWSYITQPLPTIASGGTTSGHWAAQSISGLVPFYDLTNKLSIAKRIQGCVYNSNNTVSAYVAPTTPGTVTVGASGYAYAGDGSNGGDDYSVSFFDMPVIDTSIGYASTYSGNAVYCSGFTLAL